MILFTRPAYYYGGSVALVASWALAIVLSGCRFGNHVESAPNPDKFSGYYDTQPQTLTFCTTHGSTQCAEASTHLVPPLVATHLTNPVAFYAFDLQNGIALMTSPSNTQARGLPVYFDPDRTLSYLAVDTPVPLFGDDACKSTLSLEERGAIVDGTPNPVPGSARQTSGRIQLRVTVIEEFKGDCAPSLQRMSDCYHNVTQCGAGSASGNESNQAYVQSLFDPYIEAGAMSAGDIPSLSNIAYEVEYR